MKKKTFVVLLCIATLYSGSYAQQTFSAFNHFSTGIEISTTGFGLEVATPLSPNFIIRGGFSILPYKYNASFELNVSQSILDKIDEAVIEHPDIVDILQQKGLPTRAENISRDINTNASLKMANGKLLVDYYPSIKSSFHISAGVYFGSGDILKVKGKMDEATNVLNVLKDYADVDYFNETYVIDESKGYQLSGKDIMDLQGKLKVNPVKPYIGLGFGRAIPVRRVGVNFEIGAIYQGTPKLISSSANIQKLIDNELSDISAVLKRISLYPVVSVKLYVKIF
ncbi:MAG: hypothetical protein FWD66_07195 [Paludibacter sp.]|nr:hypothetical protein [Paludibacter sp.]